MDLPGSRGWNLPPRFSSKRVSRLSEYAALTLALCSLLAVFLIVERALALRVSRVAPESVLKSVLNGNLDQVGPADGESVAGRLVQRWKDGASGETLKAWARHELSRLQRGLHLLDSVVAAAPLLGLLGTVAGLATAVNNANLASVAAYTQKVPAFNALLARVQEHRDAGADHVCVQVLSDDLMTPTRDEWRRLAPALVG